MVSLHLKAIFMLVCLKRFVIFLICGDVYVNVVHFVSCLEVVGVVGWVSFFFILCFRLVIRHLGKLFLCAMCNMFCHSSWRCSLWMGRMSILLTRNRYAASLCSGGWLGRKFIAVSVVVGLQCMAMSRWDGFLVIVRSRKLTLRLFS